MSKTKKTVDQEFLRKKKGKKGKFSDNKSFIIVKNLSRKDKYIPTKNYLRTVITRIEARRLRLFFTPPPKTSKRI